MDKCFVVVSGLPGSGKSTLARRLAPVLGLPLLDKDEILERLFDAGGAGDRAWRRALSRESDTILIAEAMASDGAVLVSHWHLPGMPADSGTPVAWLAELPGRLVNVRCTCDPDIAAARFMQRRRHPGHADADRPEPDVVESIRFVAGLEPLRIAACVEVDTSRQPDLDIVLRDVRDRFNT